MVERARRSATDGDDLVERQAGLARGRASGIRDRPNDGLGAVAWRAAPTRPSAIAAIAVSRSTKTVRPSSASDSRAASGKSMKPTRFGASCTRPVRWSSGPGAAQPMARISWSGRPASLALARAESAIARTMDSAPSRGVRRSSRATISCWSPSSVAMTERMCVPPRSTPRKWLSLRPWGACPRAQATTARWRRRA